MEKFLALSEKKQKNIIDASLFLFGQLGYRKASAGDIAKEAGISKSMLFHYFGNKKSLYLYLIQYSKEIVLTSIEKMELKDGFAGDFFERILECTKLKLEVMHKHPALKEFLSSVYFETEEEVADEIQNMLKEAKSMRNEFALSELDTFKFKDSVKPELVLSILVKYAEGYMGEVARNNAFDLKSMILEITECIIMMRNHFYKEEYI